MNKFCLKYWALSLCLIFRQIYRMPRYITYQRRKCNTSTKQKFFLHCTYKWSVIFKWSHNIFPVHNKSWKKLILHNNYWSKQITNKPGLAHVPGDLHGFPNTKEILHKLLQTNQTMWNFTGNLQSQNIIRMRLIKKCFTFETWLSWVFSVNTEKKKKEKIEGSSSVMELSTSRLSCRIPCH